MTHTAGLPDGALWPADSSFRHRPKIPPGRQFHYCNMGWQALGHLIEVLDGRPLGESIRARILVPLGMHETTPVTDFGMRARLATSYWPKFGDRPYPRDGALVEAPAIISTDGAGCVSSTASDMARYLAMLIGDGRGPNGRVVSADGFTRFTTPHVRAREFGEQASYGYGLVVDRLDGHRRLRHTGGMVSFASALEVDVDGGFGVFVSLNAMQGFRPRPIAEYALRLMRAVAEGAPLPAVPPASDPLTVEMAERFEGRFVDAAGAVLDVRAADDRLVWWTSQGAVPLEPSIDAHDAFHVHLPDYTRFLLLARRRADDSRSSPIDAFAWGERLWLREGLARPTSAVAPAAWGAFPGHYRSEDPWIGSARVVLREGRLWWNGVVPMDPGEEPGLFYLRDAEQSLEWVRFRDIGGGRSYRLELSGESLTRVSTD
jgi:hypothetical protein